MNNIIYQGHIIRKRFGQNFLHDCSIIDAIVTTIDPKPGQAIVEIGPGLGALTKPVAKRIDTMTVVEIDHNLASRLAIHPLLQSKLNIMQQDVMTVDFAILFTKQGKALRLFGNLPYNISTQIIFYLFKYMHIIHDMHFMLQKEVVNRLIAVPNSKAYGRLSIIAQYYCKIIPILEVPMTSFQPASKVDSAVVKLVPYAILPFPVSDLNKLIKLITIVFNQRRKILRNSLSNLFSERQLVEQGIDVTLRAENLSIEDYCKLANVL